MSAVSTDRPLKVLVVEDNRIARDLLRLLLRSAGFHVVSAATAREAIANLSGRTHVLLDLNLLDGTGVEVMEAIRSEYSNTSVALTTAEEDDSPMMLAAKRHHPDAIFHKPLDLNQLLEWLKRQL